MSHLNQSPNGPTAQSPSQSPTSATSANVHDAAQPSIQHVGDSVTTGTLPVITPERRGPIRERPTKQPLGLWLGVLGVVTVVGGAIAGLVWKLVVPLTTYAVNSDGGAVTSERGLANYVAGDVWFTGLGLVLGLGLGLLVWRWFAGVGWPVVVIAVFGATVMALSCWQTGWWLGPGAFEPRLASASPGDVLPIELTVRAPAAVLAWPFGAVLPIMLLSSLLRDPEESGVRPPPKARKPKKQVGPETS
ncbi:hypothetical protein [Mariniluteicoccus flavus]